MKQGKTSRRVGSRRPSGILSFFLSVILLLNLSTPAFADFYDVGTMATFSITSNQPFDLYGDDTTGEKPTIWIAYFSLENNAPYNYLCGRNNSYVEYTKDDETSCKAFFNGLYGDSYNGDPYNPVTFGVHDCKKLFDERGMTLKKVNINGISLEVPTMPLLSDVPREIPAENDPNNPDIPFTDSNCQAVIRTRWVQNRDGNDLDFAVILTTDGKDMIFKADEANVSISFEFEGGIEDQDALEYIKNTPHYQLTSSEETTAGGADVQFISNKLKEGVVLAQAKKEDIVGTTYTVTASATPGYEYDGYTLTTASGTETVAWDKVDYTYDTKESGSGDMRDSRCSTATFDVTIFEDATLEFHFKEMDIDALFAQMGEETSISRFPVDVVNPETSVSFSPGWLPDGTPVKSYKAGDWAYINLHALLHGTIPWQASEEPVKISVYAGNGAEGNLGKLLVSGSNQLSTGAYSENSVTKHYPINLHPYTSWLTGDTRGLTLDLRLQLPETDYITAVVEWPYYNKTWNIPIKVMDTNDAHVIQLRELYNSLRTSTGYDPFRYNLDYIYESEVSKILAADTDEEKGAILEQSLKLVEDAAKGVGADAVVWRISGNNRKTGQWQDSKPILVAVPSNDSGYFMSAHYSTIAALEAFAPNNWTYEYTMTAFGAAVNLITWGGADDSGKEITHKGPGFDDGNYGSFFNDRDGYSRVGVSGYKTEDGSTMAWNSGVGEGIWTWAMLRYYFDLDDARVDEELRKRGVDGIQSASLGIATMEELFKDVDLDKNGNYTDDFRRYGRFCEISPASEVRQLIKAIGSVSPRSGPAIEKARAAYEALSNEEKTKVTNLDDLEAAEARLKELLGSSITSENVTTARNIVLAAFQNTKPQIGSIGGEWGVLAVARQLMTKPDALPAEGAELDDDVKYAQIYLAALNRELGLYGLPGLDPSGSQHTEYSRIILALSALGIDAEKFQYNGDTVYDLVAKLKETDPVISQGINGPVFALLALDSKPYYPENTALRQTYIKEILSKQISDGGFSYNGVESDVDMTAMAIQALAPYYLSNLDVQKAVNRALTRLAGMQSPAGGFYSGGTYNSESCSQVIVALTALAYHTGNGNLNGDNWTVCGTTFKNPVDALMAFYKDGKFGHALGEQDDMATEQAAYALVAYSRYTNSKTPLYTMQDAFETGGSGTDTDRAAVEAARTKVIQEFSNLNWLDSLFNADRLETAVMEKIQALNLGTDITTNVTVNAVSAPVPGKQDNPNGTDGKAAFTVTLKKGSVTLTAAFGKDFPAEKYVSGDFGLRSVTVLGKAGKFQEDGTILVTLEQELAEQGFRFDQSEIKITPKDSGAEVVNLRQSGFNWIFAIKAENKNCSPDYTIRVAFSDVPQEIAQANVDAAASIVEAARNETLPTSVDATSETAIAQWAESLIPDSADVTQKAEITSITKPVDGTRDNPTGTNGTATVKVTVTDTYVAAPEQSAGIEDNGQEQLDAAREKISAAKSLAAEALNSAELPDETDADTLKTWAETQLAAIPNWSSEVNAETVVTVKAPIAGTAESPAGTPGKVAFTVVLTCIAGEAEVKDTLTVERELPAAAYVPPADPAEPPENQDQNDAPQEEEDKTPAPDDSIIKEPVPGEGEKQPDEPKAEDKTENEPTAADTVPSMAVQALSIVSNAAPEAVQTVQKETTITVILPAKPYVPSNSTRILSLTYNGTPLTADDTGYVYALELPYGEMLNTARISIQTAEGSTAGSLTDKGNGLYQFTVTAEDGRTTATYSINVTSVSGTKEENQSAVNAAYAKINSLDSWTVPSETVKNTESGIRTYINTSIAGLTGGVSSKIEVTSFTAAKDGSKENVRGTDGSYAATITLSKGIYGSSTYAEETVTIEGTITAKAFEAKPEGEITVTFTLLGDDDHGDPGTTNTHTLAGGNLDTWIPTQTVTVPAGSTVGDVFSMVLDEWGYRYIGLEGNYIKTIITPRGLRLSEFTNGKLSGWMYTVNGEHPNQGLNKWEVFNGDEIVWHYTDDYTKERSGTGSSNTSSTELTPTAVVRNGSASASVSNDDLLGAVQAAVQNRIGNILIAPAGAERADTLSVSLPADALSEAGYNGVGVTVESGAGIVVIPGSAVSGIARTARGYDVTITAAAQSVYQAERLLDGEELTEDQLTGCSVTEVTIYSGRTNITSWNGGSITLSLPVDSRNFEARERYTVYQISDDGSMETHTGRCVKQGGALYVEIDVTHLSTFVVVPTAAETVEDAKIPEALPTNIYVPFADTMNHWALDSIGYVYQRGLMSGTSSNTFQPNANMSRAMFVTVLHRLEGTPDSNGMTAYTDVETGRWYTNAVSWATAAGIVNGTGANTFSPNASISREEMATMMLRYAKYKGYDTAATAEVTGYADAYQIHDWAYRAMEWANGTGMITGRTAFSLEPQGTATRAETATILVRFIQKFAPGTSDLY